MKRLLVVALVALGCSGGAPRKIGGQPSWRQGTTIAADGSTETLVEFSPPGPARQRYGESPSPAPHSALGDAVVAAAQRVAAALGKPAPIADGRLFAVAEELAAVAPEDGVIAYSLVEFALYRHGIVEPSPHLLVVWGDLSRPELIVEQLAPRLPELLELGASTRLGIGAAQRADNGDGVVIFAMQGSSVMLRPIPRSVAADAVVPIVGTVLGPFRGPEVFVTRDDGSVVSLASRPGATEFAAELDCTGRRGAQQIEVTAADASGSTVLANFPVWCGQDPPTTIRVATDDRPVQSATDAEQRILALVNQERQTHGLGPLVWDDHVAQVARGHSEEMQRTGAVAHISPLTGSAADRVRTAGIKTAAVLENVARAYGVREAHSGLMNSPGHRANVLSSVATHLGVGVVLGENVAGRRELFVTQVFTRVPPRIDPAAVAAVVRDRINKVRTLASHPHLDRTAQDLADQLARGDDRDRAVAQAKRTLDAVAARYRRVGSVITAVGDLDALTAEALLASSVATEVGIGIAQGPHPDIGEGAIWIVLFLGEVR